jgi:hypothetical protein
VAAVVVVGLDIEPCAVVGYNVGIHAKQHARTKNPDPEVSTLIIDLLTSE